MTIKGFADSEAEKVYAPARELCDRQGASLESFKVLWSLGLCYLFRAQMHTAREVAEQLVRQADDLQDSTLILEAHLALGVTLVSIGEFALALQHLERASELYDSFRQDPYFLLTGNDAKVTSHCFAAWALWSLGHVDQSLNRIDQALMHAHEISHTQSLVGALYFAAQLHQLRREATVAQQKAATAIALAKEHELELWAALSEIYNGWAQVEQGEIARGIDRMRVGMALYQSTGAKLWRSHFLGLFAEALGGAGQIEAGQSALVEALAIARDTGEQNYLAELYRIQGELLIMQTEGASTDGASGSPGGAEISKAREAEASFNQAIAVARRQQAQSWELRATVSLGRLYLRQGEREKARQLVADICGWFTEGADTADMKEAKALLDDLEQEGESITVQK